MCQSDSQLYNKASTSLGQKSECADDDSSKEGLNKSHRHLAGSLACEKEGDGESWLQRTGG